MSFKSQFGETAKTVNDQRNDHHPVGIVVSIFDVLELLGDFVMRAHIFDRFLLESQVFSYLDC